MALTALLPGAIKRSVYRVIFKYRVGPKVRLGFTLLDADEVDLDEGACVGHFNLVTRVGRLEVGRHARIGVLNIFRGGERIKLGDYSHVMRLNVLNAIPDNDCTTEPRSVIEVGPGTVITSGHWIDFTDKVILGRNVIIGGRSSSLWTHNRQETAPIEIGDFCYLGSEVRLAPGAKLPDECILGIGAVLTGKVQEPRSLVAGVPAKVIRALNESDLARVRKKTHKDMPDEPCERQ